MANGGNAGNAVWISRPRRLLHQHDGPARGGERSHATKGSTKFVVGGVYGGFYRKEMDKGRGKAVEMYWKPAGNVCESGG